MINLIGWFASLSFSLSALPQAYYCYKHGNANGISFLFILLWGSGEILTLVYVLLKHGYDLPLVTNYLMNLLFLFIILKYKLFPRRNNESK